LITLFCQHLQPAVRKFRGSGSTQFVTSKPPRSTKSATSGLQSNRNWHYCQRFPKFYLSKLTHWNSDCSCCELPISVSN